MPINPLPNAAVTDVNIATNEQIQRAFQTGEETARQIISNRPYQDWADFKKKNPGFSAPVIDALRESGVVIGAIQLHRVE
jgi:DNA uptake protein ComE-like DNA-binding protein